MAKPIAAVVKLQVPAGQATPAPPVGTALGPHGVNIMEFVKQFNAKTAHAQGMITPVEVTIFKDRTFTFITKTPPAAVLLKKEAGIEKGSPTSNRQKVGKVTRAQVRNIAELKMPDLNANDIEAAMKMVAVPATIFIAASISLAFKSGIFSSAMLRTWARVTFPTFCRFDVGLPFSIPASFFRSTAAGGVLVMNVNVRSLKIVTSTGVIMPCACAVLALNCLTNSMMFTPCGPSAVPTGGAGVACPAGTWSFTTAAIGLAISAPSIASNQARPTWAARTHRPP